VFLKTLVGLLFLKTLVGLLKPEKGSIWINDRDLTTLREHDLYEVRRSPVSRITAKPTMCRPLPGSR
jgi:ABC-type proline/glycine betaine transport system ATPase subunit